MVAITQRQTRKPIRIGVPRPGANSRHCNRQMPLAAPMRHWGNVKRLALKSHRQTRRGGALKIYVFKVTSPRLGIRAARMLAKPFVRRLDVNQFLKGIGGVYMVIASNLSHPQTRQRQARMQVRRLALKVVGRLKWSGIAGLIQGVR